MVTVPDSWLKEVNALLEAGPEAEYVTVTREEEGVAITMEGTGLGNSITALGELQLGRAILVRRAEPGKGASCLGQGLVNGL